MSRPPYREAACALCRVSTRVDFLVDAAELLPFGGLVCAPCEAELLADNEDPHAGEAACICHDVCSLCTPGA